MKITNIHGRWVLDSRGEPTIEVDVTLWGGAFGRASVPSGVAIGRSEASELRDNVRPFGGMGVSRALNGIEYTIKPKLVGMNADDQERIDAVLCALDGTSDKHNLGSNAILAVSLAIAKAVAQHHSMPLYRYFAHLSGHRELSLPVPQINIISGGLHAVHSIDAQEVMIIPVGAHDVHTAVRMSSEIFQHLKHILSKNKISGGLGDEGGFSVSGIASLRRALDFLLAAIASAGYKPGRDIAIALDIAASQIYRDGQYHFLKERKNLSVEELNSWYIELLESYPIVSIEDPFDQEAWNDWTAFTKKHTKLQVVADDLITTNERRLHRALREKAANAILIKPSHIGTLTETVHVTKLAQQHGLQTIIASRAGDTEDATIAHLAVGLKTGQLKAGSVARGERTAKYNELLRISESLKSDLLTSVWTERASV